jgi:hypothetical protein
VEQEAREQVLPIFGHLLQTIDGFLEGFGHA